MSILDSYIKAVENSCQDGKHIHEKQNVLAALYMATRRDADYKQRALDRAQKFITKVFKEKTEKFMKLTNKIIKLKTLSMLMVKKEQEFADLAQEIDDLVQENGIDRQQNYLLANVLTHLELEREKIRSGESVKKLEAILADYSWSFLINTFFGGSVLAGICVYLAMR